MENLSSLTCWKSRFLLVVTPPLNQTKEFSFQSKDTRPVFRSSGAGSKKPSGRSKYKPSHDAPTLSHVPAFPVWSRMITFAKNICLRTTSAFTGVRVSRLAAQFTSADGLKTPTFALISSDYSTDGEFNPVRRALEDPTERNFVQLRQEASRGN